MKRLIYIVVALVLAGGVLAQDAQRLGETDLLGTARYVALSGAMTAVGGDASAVRDNPAGLGVYRRMEISASLYTSVNRAVQTGGVEDSKNVGYGMSQASWVFAFPSSGKLASNNLMFSFRRLRSFNRQYDLYNAQMDNSLLDVVALKTNGLPEANLRAEGRWDNPEVGWLSILGYESYLINPVGDSQHSWLTPLSMGEKVSGALRVVEYGHVDEYGLSWALRSANNHVMFGVGLNVQSLSFEHETSYAERTSSGKYVQNSATLLMSGLGINGAVGILYHPVRFLRMGVSYISPTWSSLSVGNYGEMSSNFGPSKVTVETPSDSRSVYRDYSQPMHVSAGVAFQFSHYGLLSLQYDYSALQTIYNTHALRAGMEWVVCRRLFMEMGYSIESMCLDEKQKNAFVENNALDYNTIRTNTDFERVRSTQYASVGLGYRGYWGLVHLAYQYRWQGSDVFVHEIASADYLHSENHRVVLTLNWHSW